MADPPDPRSFFTERLPAQIEHALRSQERALRAAQHKLDGMRSARGAILAVVGNESFWLRLEDGYLRAGEKPDEPPVLTLVQTPADFARLVQEAGHSPLAFLGSLAGSGELALTKDRLDAMRALEGSLRFRVTGEAGFAVVAHFGAAPVPAEPDASIELDPEVYAALRKGELELQQAFLANQLRIEGDVGLAMRVALAVMTD